MNNDQTPRNENKLYDFISNVMNSVARQLEHDLGVNFNDSPLLTGKLHVDVNTHDVWFEVQDQETGTTSWVSPTAVERVALGEFLASAASLDEALYSPHDEPPC